MPARLSLALLIAGVLSAPALAGDGQATSLLKSLAGAPGSRAMPQPVGPRRIHPARTVAPRPAGTVVVTNCDDAGPGSLRDAVENAVSGDVVDLTALSCSTISLATGALATDVDDLTVDGPGPEALAIDAAGSSRIFDHGGTGTLTLNGLALRNGSYTSTDFTGPGFAQGGCAYSAGRLVANDVHASGCRVDGATAEGAAFWAWTSLDLTDSKVTAAVANAHSDTLSSVVFGGTLFGFLGMNLVRTEVTDSTSTSATNLNPSGNSITTINGGVIWTGQSVAITDSVITGAFASASSPNALAWVKGGSVYAANGAAITNTTIANSSLSAPAGTSYDYQTLVLGAGVYIAGSGSPTTITGSTITGNYAHCNGSGDCDNEYTAVAGGALASRVPVTLVNSTISGNASQKSGGGIVGIAFASITLANSTITGNSAPTAPGIFDNGIYVSTPLVTNSSIVAGNTGFGPDPALNTDVVSVHTVTGANNLIGGANVDLPADTLGGDPMLGPLADNGGPTQTHALLPGSPAIDHGNNLAGLAVDQRGGSYVRAYGNGVDIGAFELQPGPVTDRIFGDGFELAGRR
jgi:hypothetical protein